MYTKDSTARTMPKKKGLERLKERPVSHITGDAKKITEYLRFLEQNPNATRLQLQKHVDECGHWISMMDHRINDCEHFIALSTISETKPELVARAHELLTESLGFRIRLKAHRQECLDRLLNKETVLNGEREYHVRTLHEAFGHVITIENNLLVIR